MSWCLLQWLNFKGVIWLPKIHSFFIWDTVRLIFQLLLLIGVAVLLELFQGIYRGWVCLFRSRLLLAGCTVNEVGEDRGTTMSREPGLANNRGVKTCLSAKNIHAMLICGQEIFSKFHILEFRTGQYKDYYCTLQRNPFYFQLYAFYIFSFSCHKDFALIKDIEITRFCL